MSLNLSPSYLLSLAYCPFLDTEEILALLQIRPDLLSKNTSQQLRDYQAGFNYHHELALLRKYSIHFLSLFDSNYPACFRDLFVPPPFIFCQGNLELLTSNNYNLAVVGSRQHSINAPAVIDKLLKFNSNIPPITIISGLARGVDTLAHQIALDQGLPTIAILGSGLFQENIYPPENTGLVQRIVNNNGLVISEFAPNSGPLASNFPKRNRLISALAQSILIIEAGQRSGALITARIGLDLNKDILAVPGSILSPTHLGSNKLIQSGAYPITTKSDLINFITN